MARRTFSPRGELLSVTDPLNQTTSYGYDEEGNLIRITDAEGRTSTFAYTGRNQLNARAQAEEIVNGQVQRAYTYGNNLLNQRQLNNGNAVTHFLGKDADGNTRLLTDAAGAVTDTFAYDAFGNQLERTGFTSAN